MKLGWLHRYALVLTLTVALLGLLQTSAITAACAGATILLIWVRAPRLHDAKRPRWLHWVTHTGTVLGLLGAIALFTRVRVDAVLIVVMLGVANRWLLRAGHRDDLILIGASTVLFAVNTTVSPGLEFLVLLVAWLPITLWALWAATLFAAAPHRARRRVPDGMRTIALGGFALTMAAFLVVSLLPRYRFGRIFTAGYLMQLAGAGDTMELRTGGVRPPGSGRPVMQVEPKAGTGSGIVQGLYARMFTLDTFDGRAFSASPPGRTQSVYRVRAQFRGDHRDFEPMDSPGTVRVTLERVERRGRNHPIPALGRSAPGYVMIPILHQAENGLWSSPATKAQATVVYKVDLDRPAPIRRWPRVWRPAVEQRLLQLPDEIDPRVVDLARRLTDGEDTTRGKIKKVLAHFERGYTYSLEPLEGESDDPLVKFIFEAKAGHCELYAAAVAVLLRLNRIPARVVTGYYGGWWNDTGGYQEFTDADAHAWVEVYDDGYGWRWVDATPASERMRGKDRSWAELLGFYRALEKLWYDRVVDFDESKRRRFIENLSKRMDALELSVLYSDDTPGSEGRGRSRGGFALGLVGLALVAAVLLVIAARRRRTPAALGHRLRRALGAARDENATLGELLSRTKRPRDVAATAVQAYEAWRFGAGAEPSASAPVRRAIHELERGRTS